MNNIRFACTSLLGTNKVGNLSADENGYYTMVVGALNMFNSAGQYYVFDQARELFEESSQFMRRVKRGALRGEYGHPKQEGMNDRAFAHRAMAIYEERVCCHHAEIWLDFESVKGDDGRPVIAIMSKVSPSGPLAHVLERQLKNTKENVCFSIRSFTDDFMHQGVRKRALKAIVTFDYVNEPGMYVAEKYRSPALESFGDEKVFGRADIEAGIAESQRMGFGQESVVMTADDLFRSMGWEMPRQGSTAAAKLPGWAGWK